MILYEHYQRKCSTIGVVDTNNLTRLVSVKASNPSIRSDFVEGSSSPQPPLPCRPPLSDKNLEGNMPLEVWISVEETVTVEEGRIEGVGGEEGGDTGSECTRIDPDDGELRDLGDGKRAER